MDSKIIEFNVNGDRLQGVLSPSSIPSDKAVLLLHPHPLYGGRRDDRVVRFFDGFFLKEGHTTFRFNFRGVNSPAEYKGIPSAIQDARAAAQVLLDETQHDSLAIVGYSFGGSVALHLASQVNADFLVTLSASLGLAQEATDGLKPLDAVHCPTMMFHGDCDNMVPFDDMLILAKKLGVKDVQTVALEGEGHFYTKHLNTTGSYLSAFLKQMTED